MNDRSIGIAMVLAALPIGSLPAADGQRTLGPIEQRIIESASGGVLAIGPGVYRATLPGGRTATYWFGGDGAAWMRDRGGVPDQVVSVLVAQTKSSTHEKGRIAYGACQGAYDVEMEGGLIYGLPGYHLTDARVSVKRGLGGPPPQDYPLSTFAYAALGSQAAPNGSENQTSAQGTGQVVAQTQATCPSPGACSTSWVTYTAFTIQGCDSGGIEMQGAN